MFSTGAGGEEDRVKAIRNIALVVAFLATLGPIAHLLELPSKLTLDGALWLSIQQNLYRGWGTLFGPVEIAALLCSLALFLWTKGDRGHRNGYLIAVVCYLSMIAYFFLFNDVVNQALNHWTAATLPHDWTRYRLKWETGHALAALFSVVAFVVLLQAYIREALMQHAGQNSNVQFVRSS